MPIRKSRCLPFLLTLRVFCTSLLLTAIPYLTQSQVAMRMTGEVDCDKEQLLVRLEAKSTSG